MQIRKQFNNLTAFYFVIKKSIKTGCSSSTFLKKKNWILSRKDHISGSTGLCQPTQIEDHFTSQSTTSKESLRLSPLFIKLETSSWNKLKRFKTKSQWGDLWTWSWQTCTTCRLKLSIMGSMHLCMMEWSLDARTWWAWLPKIFPKVSKWEV